MDYLLALSEALQRKNLTPNTCKSYISYLRSYLEFLSGRNILPMDASWQDMSDFLSDIQRQRNLSDRTVNMIISYLRFFHVYVLHKQWDPSQIPFRTFNTFLPYVPSDDVVRAVLDASTDPKFYLVIVILYATGMRLDELCHLKCADISHSTGMIHIRCSKNHSDRFVPLPDSIYQLILSYWRSLPPDKRPRDWLFTQQRRLDTPMDKQWVQSRLLAIRTSLGLDPRLCVHSFRHAYATSCYLAGMDLVTLKAYLGHASLNSTCIYIQLAASASRGYVCPFDRLTQKGGSLV